MTFEEADQNALKVSQLVNPKDHQNLSIEHPRYDSIQIVTTPAESVEQPKTTAGRSLNNTK